MLSWITLTAFAALAGVGCTAQVDGPVDPGSSPAAQATTDAPDAAPAPSATPSGKLSTEMSMGCTLGYRACCNYDGTYCVAVCAAYPCPSQYPY